MKIKIKLVKPGVTTRADIEILVREIVELKIQLQDTLNAMDAAITQTRMAYESRRVALEEAVAVKSRFARNWAESNPAEFGPLKSLALLHGDLGWRTGQPQLKTVTGWTWDRVLERLKTVPAWLRYVRVKEEVNKQALLGDREVLGSEALRRPGVRVTQEETFFIEPRLEAAARRSVPPAN